MQGGGGGSEKRGKNAEYKQRSRSSQRGRCQENSPGEKKEYIRVSVAGVAVMGSHALCVCVGGGVQANDEAV